MVNNFKKLTILLTVLSFTDSSNLFSGGTRKHSRHHTKAEKDSVKKSKHSRHHSKIKEDSPKKLKHSDHSKAKEEWEALRAILNSPISPERANKYGDSCKKWAIIYVKNGDLDAGLENYLEAIRYYKISKNTDQIASCYEKIIELLKSSNSNLEYLELEKICEKELSKLRD